MCRASTWNRLGSRVGLMLCLFVSLSVTAAGAQENDLTLRCPTDALNLTLYSDTIAAKIKASVDPALYQNVRVRIRTRLLGLQSGSIAASSSQVISGLSVAQTGLISVISGALSFQPLCQFRYVIRSTVTATEIASGVRLSSTNEGIITISSGGEVEVKRR